MMFHSLHAGVVQITDIPSRPVHVTMTIAPPVLPDSAKAEAVSRREPADVAGTLRAGKPGAEPISMKTRMTGTECRLTVVPASRSEV
jgi:hypothetical protein